jgi:hypothetical protein
MTEGTGASTAPGSYPDPVRRTTNPAVGWQPWQCLLPRHRCRCGGTNRARRGSVLCLQSRHRLDEAAVAATSSRMTSMARAGSLLTSLGATRRARLRGAELLTVGPPPGAVVSFRSGKFVVGQESVDGGYCSATWPRTATASSTTLSRHRSSLYFVERCRLPCGEMRRPDKDRIAPSTIAAPLPGTFISGGGAASFRPVRNGCIRTDGRR